MCADIFTKHFSDRKKSIWKGVRQNVNVFSPEEIPLFWAAEGVGHASIQADIQQRIDKHCFHNSHVQVVPFMAMSLTADQKTFSLERLGTLPHRLWAPRGKSYNTTIEQRLRHHLANSALIRPFAVIDYMPLRAQRTYHVLDDYWNCLVVGHASSLLVENETKTYQVHGQQLIRAKAPLLHMLGTIDWQ